MKLVTTARHLRDALRTAAMVVEKHNRMPILGCVVIEGRSIRATDLDMEVRIDLPASVAEGSAAIDCRSLSALLRYIAPDEVATIKSKGADATVAFNGGRYDLFALAPETFPDAKFEAGSAYALDGAGLGKALAFCRPAAGTEETRYYLNGVCLSLDTDGKPVMVATDGHRMAVCPMASDPAIHKGLIIPSKTAGMLHKLPDPHQVVVGATEVKLQFIWPGMTLTTKLIEGTFPDWNRVQPKIDEASPAVTMSRHDLDQRLARIGTISEKSMPGCVNVAFVEGRAVLTARCGDATAREYLPAAATNAGEGRAVSLNGRYLRDVLRMFAGHDNVRIALSGDGAPMRITAPGGEAFALLMPMRGEPELALKALGEKAEADNVEVRVAA